MTVRQIHSSLGADLTFKGTITLLHCELAFSKAKESINTRLTSGSDIILFTAEVNLCKFSESFYRALYNFSKWLSPLS